MHPKNLDLTLTFRGVLTFMYSAYEYWVERIEGKKGKQETEINEKRNEIKRRKERLKVLTEKIHKVIRNPYVIKEAPSW